MNNISIILLVLFVLHGSAQDIKHQSDEFKNIAEGDYIAYLTHKNGDKYIGGIDDKTYRIVSSMPEPNFPDQHYIITFINGSNKEKTTLYMPDDMTFPITYVNNVFEGNKKMQEAIGYAPRKYSYAIKDRLVFLEGNIYVITDWKDKENYTLKAILEQGKMPGNFKKMKLVMKSPKRLKEMDPEKKLKDYLEAAYAIKGARKAEWIKDAKNNAALDKMELTSTLVLKAMKKQNDDYKKSDEYKRIQELNAYFEKRDNTEMVTLINKTGKEIYLYAEGSRNSYGTIGNQYSKKVECNKTYYYTFKPSSDINGGGMRCYTSNSNCGSTVTIN